MYNYDFSSEKVKYENTNSIVEINNNTINCSVLITDKNILLFDNVNKNNVLIGRGVQIQPEYELILKINIDKLNYKIDDNDTIINDYNLILYDINIDILI